MRALCLLTLLLWSLTGAAQVRPSQPIEACAQHLPYGAPRSARLETTLICRQGYALEHDNRAKVPMWVAYTLTPLRAVGCATRDGTFEPDPSLSPSHRAEVSDYSRSGFDTGHLAPSGDMRWSEQVQRESSVLSNAAPQRPSFNRGPWRVLEDQVRAWAATRDALLVYTGPIYERTSPRTIGRGRVVVPRAFYKVLVDQQAREVVAFIYPATVTQGSPRSFVVPLAEVERQAGFRLPVPQGVIEVAWKPAPRVARSCYNRPQP